MGQAKQRGTFEERRAQSIERIKQAQKEDDDRADRQYRAPRHRSRMPALMLAAAFAASAWPTDGPRIRNP